MYERFTDRARKVMQLANQQAMRLNHDYLGTEHLILGLVKEGTGVAANVLKNLEVDLRKILLEVEKLVQSCPESVRLGKLPPTPAARKVIEYASEESLNLNHSYVGTEHLLLGLMRQRDGVAAVVLMNLGLKLEEVRAEIRTLSPPGLGRAEESPSRSPPGKSKTPALDSFSRDLTALAVRGELETIVGRDRELEFLARVLCCRANRGVLVVGQSGVGKSALAYAFAQRIVDGDVPTELRDTRLCALDFMMMVAGTKFRGQFEERWKAILTEIRRVKNVVLLIENIHLMMAYQSQYPAMASAVDSLRDSLAGNELACIGVASPRAFRKYFGDDTELSGCFQRLELSEPSKVERKHIITQAARTLSSHHRVEFDADAIEAAVNLADQHIRSTSFPKKVVQLLDEAACRVRQSVTDMTVYDEAIACLEDELQDAKKSGETENLEEIEQRFSDMNQQRVDALDAFARSQEARLIDDEVEKLNRQKEDAVACQDFEKAVAFREQAKRLQEKQEELLVSARQFEGSIALSVGPDTIAQIVADRIGMPVRWLRKDVVEAQRLLEAESDLARSLLGQSDVVQAVSQSFRHVFQRGPREGRTLGCMLFLGPVGVGKSLLAQRLADFALGAGSHETINLAHFHEEADWPRLCQAVFGEATSAAAQATSRSDWPPSVLVIDHLENATADAWRLVLDIVQAGCVVDSQGRVADFTHSLVILMATTEEAPVGSLPGDDLVDLSHDRKLARERVSAACGRQMPTETISQLDCILNFRPLSPDTLEGIVRNHTQSLLSRLSDGGVEVDVTPSVYAHLLEAAQCDQAGAHHIAGAVEKSLGEPVSDQLLRQSTRSGRRLVVEMDTTTGRPTVKVDRSTIQDSEQESPKTS